MEIKPVTPSAPTNNDQQPRKQPNTFEQTLEQEIANDDRKRDE